MARRFLSVRPVPALAVAVGALAAVAAATAAAVADHRAGSASLAALGPVVGAANRIGAVLLLEPPGLVVAVAAAATLALGAAALAARRRAGADAAGCLAAVAAAVAGQAAIAVGSPAVGVVGYSAALALLLLARLGEGGAELPFDPEGYREATGWREAAALLAIVAVATVLRFFALDRVVDNFEGELAPYMVGATDLKGMLLANAGVDGPWSPMGLLYYLPIRLGVEVAGSTVLAVRLGSAIVAVLTVVAGYLLAREIAGRTAGLAAAAMLALDPLQIGWGRSDVSPHGATAWPGMLLGIATLRLLATGRTRWAVATALLMGLVWHQYPSGQLAVAVPVLVVAGRALSAPRQVLGLGWRLLALPAGAALWLLGHPLTELAATGRWVGPADFVVRLGPRVGGPGTAPSAGEHLATLAGHAADLVEGVFVRVPHLFHQTFLPQIPGLGQRALPWMVAALAFVGVAVLALRPLRPGSLTVLALLAAGAAPAVFSDVAYVKRAAVVYPVAAVAAAIACAAVAAALRAADLRRAGRLLAAGATLLWLGWACVASHQWLSGRWYPWGRPAEEAIAAEVAAEIRPHTVVLAGVRDNYMEGKLTYLLSDVLTRPGLQPVVWIVRHQEQWGEGAPDLRRELDELGGSPRWPIRWSSMRRTVPAALASGRWRRVVVIAERSPELERWLAALAGRWRVVDDRRIDAGWQPKHRMRLLVLELDGRPLPAVEE